MVVLLFKCKPIAFVCNHITQYSKLKTFQYMPSLFVTLKYTQAIYGDALFYRLSIQVYFV